MSFSAAKETALEVFIGEDWLFDFDITDEAEAVAIDITGWALSFMVKRKLTDANGAALITKTTGSGITIAGTFDADPADNTQRATVELQDTDTDNLKPALLWWELKRTDTDVEKVVAYGRLELARGVHR